MFLIDNFVETVKNYVGFEGRATRKQYWMYVLAYFIVEFILAFIDALMGGQTLTTIMAIGLLLPSLAITVRRLRDAGRGWGWIFLGLVPVLNLVLLVMLCLKSKETD